VYRDAVEQRRRFGETGFVVREELLTQRRVFGIVRRNAHPGAEQSARAGRRVRAHRSGGHGGESALAPDAVDRACEIAGAVGERSVQVEQDGFHRQRARRRALACVSRHHGA
jgi:hypothetical protein